MNAETWAKPMVAPDPWWSRPVHAVRDFAPPFQEMLDWRRAERDGLGRDRWDAWFELASDWWHGSGPHVLDTLAPLEGIDHDKAFAHLHYIARSMQLDHNHKLYSIAYLASRWFAPPAGAP